MGYHVEPEISAVAEHLPTDDVESLETMLNAFEESIQHQVPENYTNFWLLCRVSDPANSKEILYVVMCCAKLDWDLGTELMKTFCRTMEINEEMNGFQLWYFGKPVRGGDTPRSLGMGRGDVIEVKRKERKLVAVLAKEEPSELPELPEEFPERDSQEIQPHSDSK
ncbi:hypothetical protein RvY_15548 [Ramazzottius varieornatus]|uniref:Ubiquitin-like domain-containing protein n=1 Tax=Ramazzottius varieornatus TaxID=947166 RepID=A0A1D1VZY5_RAMVA|nr:hypothetical protein RvY_15548 [Ramazzottius varieornatus]